MNPLVLHDNELDADCYKVRLLLSFLGVPYTRVAVNMIPGGEHARPPLLLLNPLASLPILEIDAGRADALVLREAEAILPYLALCYDRGGSWLPPEPVPFAAMMMWLVFAARDLAVAVRARRCAMFGGPGDGGVEIEAARHAFRIMEDYMTLRGFDDATWFVGSGPTLADVALFPSFALSRDFGIDHEAYPALRKWFRRFRTLPGFATMPGIPHHV